MFMMFVDESGDPGYPADGNWSRFGGSPMFARVGAIIHGWKWKGWNERLIDFKRRNGLAWNDEVKASDIRTGTGSFSGWDKEKRLAFLQDLAQIVGGNTDITLIGVAIDKRRVDASKKDRLVKPQIRSMELLLERYNMFLRQQKHRAGIVILDPTRERSDDNIRYFQSYLQVHSEHLRPLHIVEGTFFAKSHTSSMIQLSDVCTNIFYRHIVRGVDGTLYSAIQPRFWRMGSRTAGYGIKTWPD